MQQNEKHTGLKFVVISMGLVLIGGMIFVISVIASRMSEHSSNSAARPASEISPACTQAALSLEAGDRIISSSRTPQGIDLVVTHGDGSQSLLTTEPCTGKIVYRLVINTVPH